MFLAAKGPGVGAFEWRRHFDQRFGNLPSLVYAIGFPQWKRRFVRQCFSPRTVRFVPVDTKVPGNACAVVWGAAPTPVGLASEGRLLRLEDGFLRSVGLGADIVRPLSWALDSAGIYYDSRSPSDLESILSNIHLDDDFLARARRLRERILDAKLTKYNVDAGAWIRPAGDRKVILVPGQVESDASIRCAAPGVRHNIELLRAVREQSPDAFILYKPHPDVVARMRAAGQDEAKATYWCDEIITTVAMGPLLDAVDEVHVITSLAGFEALLRGKRVICYGQPFYAGWGLTQDRVPLPRRQRKLSIEELVAGALIEYPLYFRRDGKGLATVEETLEDLIAWRKRAGGRNPWWFEGYRTIVRRIAGVR